MLVKSRDQDATESIDKIYTLIGWTTWRADILVDYRLSKGQVFLQMGRQLLEKTLLILIWTDSPQREICGTDEGAELPSWVPDWTTKLSLLTKAINNQYSYFGADKGFPFVSQEPRHCPQTDYGVLIIRAIIVAVITGTRNTRMTKETTMEGRDQVRLIRYMPDIQDNIIGSTFGVHRAMASSE